MRRPHRRPWTIVLLAVALVTSGCLSGDEAEDPTQQPGLEVGQPISAITAVEQVQSWAKETWSDDVEVLLASAIEAAPGSSALQSSQRSGSSYRIVADPAVGDGKVALWLFQLWSPGTGKTKTVAVSEVDLDVFDPNGSTPRNDPSTLGPWSLDSTEAAETAMEQAAFQDVSQAEDGVIFYTLGLRGGRPVWQLRANSQIAGVNAWDFVDAETGESYTRGGGDQPRERHQVLHGNVTSMAPNATYPVNLTEGHDTVDATLTWTPSPANATVNLSLRLTSHGTELVAENTTQTNRSIHARWPVHEGPLELVVTADGQGNWTRIDHTIELVTLDDPDR